MDVAKNAVLGAPGNYPSAFIGIVFVLVLIIIYMWWQGRGATKETGVSGSQKASKRAAKKEPTDEEEVEVDELIEEIHDKQKKKKGAAKKDGEDN